MQSLQLGIASLLKGQQNATPNVTFGLKQDLDTQPTMTCLQTVLLAF